MYCSSALLFALTACAAATDVHGSPFASSKENMTLSRSSMPTNILWAKVTAGTVRLPRTIYVTRTVSNYITFCQGPTSFAVQNTTYAVMNSMNVTVACSTGCIISETQSPFHLTGAPMRSVAGSFSNSLAPFRNTTATYPFNQLCPSAGTSNRVVCPSSVPCPNVASPTGVPCQLGRQCPTSHASVQGGVVPAGSSKYSPNNLDTPAVAYYSSGSSGLGAELMSSPPVSGPGSPLGSGLSMPEAGLYSAFSTSTSGSPSGSSFGSTSSGAGLLNSTPVSAESSSSLSGSSTSGSESVDDSAISANGSSSSSSFELSSLKAGSSASSLESTPESSYSALSGGSSESSNPIMSSIGAPINGIPDAGGDKSSTNEVSDNGASASSPSGSSFSNLPGKAPGMVTVTKPSGSIPGSPSMGNTGSIASEPSATSSQVVNSDASIVTRWSIVSILGVAAFAFLL